ncbi:hypothetical protein F5876DRAFT_50776, partial [Lentinula aff. lateritia]
FGWNKQWPEIARVLRPGGTVAFWVRLPIHTRSFGFLNTLPDNADYAVPPRSKPRHMSRSLLGKDLVELYLNAHLVEVHELVEVLAKEVTMTDTN